MLLQAPTRQVFADLGYASKAADYLKTCATEFDMIPLPSRASQRGDHQGEFLASRLLFLCTYETNLDFGDLFDTKDLIGSLDLVGDFDPAIAAVLISLEPLSPCKQSQWDSR